MRALSKLYTEAEIAARLHRSRRWLLEWLRENPTDATGQPFYLQVGRSKRFTADDGLRMLDLILTQEEAAATKLSEGYIYFIDGSDHVKIGFTRSIAARMVKMRTDVPGAIKLLHMEPGTFQTEKIVHRHFAALRIRGEWFRKAPELLEYIEQRKRLTSFSMEMELSA